MVFLQQPAAARSMNDRRNVIVPGGLPLRHSNMTGRSFDVRVPPEFIEGTLVAALPQGFASSSANKKSVYLE